MPPRRRASTPTPSSDLDPALLAAMESTSPFRPAQASKRSHGTMAAATTTKMTSLGLPTLGPLGSDLPSTRTSATLSNATLTPSASALIKPPLCLRSRATALPCVMRYSLRNFSASRTSSPKAVPAEVEWKSTPFFEVLVCSLCPARIDRLLEANTSAAALAIFLSSKTNVYKGEGPTRCSWSVLPSRLRHPTDNYQKIIAIKGWGVTETILKNKHSRKRIKARAQYQLTQARSKIKKAIVTSLKHGAVLNILDLTSLIASKGDDVIVNEVSLRPHSAHASSAPSTRSTRTTTFGDFLDVRIETISKAAGGDSAKIVHAFHFALTTDQKKYDTEDVYEIDKSGGSAFQDDIDGIIVGQTMAAAAAAASSAANTAGSSMANPDPFLVNA
ncbi:hypothetical protein B0H14DRAFT_3138535 [Mycena olivaceomarginata]|nr:hypothetical protein B0H14DRAFT_3138535 [Mycena olivaceomarginata]